jgi:hypothetical protein
MILWAEGGGQLVNHIHVFIPRSKHSYLYPFLTPFSFFGTFLIFSSPNGDKSNDMSEKQQKYRHEYNYEEVCITKQTKPSY